MDRGSPSMDLLRFVDEPPRPVVGPLRSVHGPAGAGSEASEVDEPTSEVDRWSLRGPLINPSAALISPLPTSTSWLRGVDQVQHPDDHLLRFMLTVPLGLADGERAGR